MSNSDITVRIADWDEEQETLRHIREVVFIHEQAVKPEEEWEGDDHMYTHFLAVTHDGKAVGTGRVSITPACAKIGRMAVLKEFRGLQVGELLLKHIIDFARSQNSTKAMLNAQTAVKDFYKKSGFKEEGKLFFEASIEHIKMVRNL